MVAEDNADRCLVTLAGTKGAVVSSGRTDPVVAAHPIAGSQLSPRVALQFAVDLTILARKHNDGTNGL